MDVADWLRALDLERYEAAFRENGVSAEDVRHLTAEDLEGLGVTAIGHRRRLLVAIAKLSEQRTTETANPVVEPATTASEPLREDGISGGERRQLTVMFCDLVGSTALSEKLDPEELRSLLHAYRTHCGDVIARYDGFVARYVGDGILTYFGWPTAHEEDAERAVRAALEIVQTVKQASSSEDLSVRIGIATGPVVVGETAGAGDQSKLAVGSTPNLAARLQGLATADQIVIAASTRRLAGNAFELTDLGEHDLKGIAEPVHAWRVERALVTESRFDASRGGSTMTPLVGREAELDLLLRRWSQAKDGEGQVALLSGEPGIGKSRILSALRERLDAQDVQALRFQCSPYYVNSAFWPIIDNFERALTFTQDETTDSKLDKLEALIVTHYGRPLADVRFVASILSIPCEARYGPVPMTPQNHKDETLRTLVDITEAAARRQPSVLLFEDAHWADPTTLEVLDLLIDRVKTVPLLVVLTHRPEFQSRWAEQGHVGALNLSKLTRAQSAAMVSTLAGGKALPSALLEQILTRTDGVPLFVEELTKSILESGELTEAGDHYEYCGSARAVTIPVTLRDSLMARLDRFMPVKEIAQIGAAIGREFSYELIAAVAPMPQAQLEDALAQLTASGLAFRRGTPPDAIYTFKHALVQDAAYDSLLKSRRQELHGKIAHVIEQRFPNITATEPEVLAHHLTAAGLAEAAIPLWQAAGELALKRMAMTEAIAHLNQGLELASTLPRSSAREVHELDLTLDLAVPLIAVHGFAALRVEECAFRAMELSGKLDGSPRRFAAQRLAWNSCLMRQPVSRTVALAWDLIGSADHDKNPAKLAIAHRALGYSLLIAGEFPEADEILARGAVLADTISSHEFAIYGEHPSIVCRIYGGQVKVLTGFPTSGARLGEEAVAHGRREKNAHSLAWALAVAANIFQIRNEPAATARFASEAIDVAREHHLPQWLALGERYMGWAMHQVGDFDAGMNLQLQGAKRWNDIGAMLHTTQQEVALAESFLREGQTARARAHLDAARAHRESYGEDYFAAEIDRLEGLVLRSEQAAAEIVEEYLTNSLNTARRQGARMLELRTATTFARVLAEHDERRRAVDLLAPVYGWFTEGFDTKDLQEAKALLAELGA